ncbi:MAG: phasin family protein [Burkholderiales bacterium]|nr:phasin family protein [Burkholderiales bacterium]
MPNVFTPIANMYQTQLEASRQFTDVIFAGTEKLDHVVIDATHRAISDQLRFVQSLAAVRDPQSVASAQSSYFSQRPDRAMEYQRELMRIFSEMQTDIGRSMRQALEQWSSNVAGSASESAENAKEQAGEVFNPVTSMFSMWESAFREVASLTSKNVEAARSGFENATNTAFTAATEAAEDMSEVASGERERKAHPSAARRKSQ